MINEDSFQYAMENTNVVLAPDRRIATFGTTRFRFHLLTELMDQVGVVRIREGQIEAQRPQIITPQASGSLELEGFGEKARRFAAWMERHSERLTLFKYGFQFRKTDIVENIVHGSLEEGIERVRAAIPPAEEALSAIIQGVDDAWEVCLLKFTMDLVQQSAGGNLHDFRRRGLL